MLGRRHSRVNKSGQSTFRLLTLPVDPSRKNLPLSRTIRFRRGAPRRSRHDIPAFSLRKVSPMQTRDTDTLVHTGICPLYLYARREITQDFKHRVFCLSPRPTRLSAI